jgi:hypothetical protein
MRTPQKKNQADKLFELASESRAAIGKPTCGHIEKKKDILAFGQQHIQWEVALSEAH